MQSTRPGGLPSGPRSRSIVRSRPDVHNATPPSSRILRPERSIASLPREPSQTRSQYTPDSRRTHSIQSRSHDYHQQDDTRFSRRSGDSAASSVSSIFDRVRGGSEYSSPRTSFEEEREEPKFRSSDNRARSLRTKRLNQSEPRSDQEREQPPVPSASGSDGTTVWSRVAAAAGELTVSVGKAWATNIVTYAGEETPAGQESRLTRAMKAYHIAQAHSTADLPAWLFSPEERHPSQPEHSRRSQKNDDGYERVEQPDRAERTKPRGLRDIYDAAASGSAARPLTNSNRPNLRQYAEETTQPSKAADRLRALRDAKRTVANSGGGVPLREPDVRPTARVGLPSGPVPRGRRV